MKVFVFFGLPGAGKTYAGKLAEKYFSYHFYEGDIDLPENMRAALENQEQITDEMRDQFFINLIASVKKLEKNHDTVVVAQTFLKEKYRQQFLRVFPNVTFVLIETATPLREKRLQQRKEYPIDITYARKMRDLFDRVHSSFHVIQNNSDGEIVLKDQMSRLFGEW